ncbi:MAG: threonine/serine dehydratase [Candidatus Heimdallarchaeota archaeon]|nr:MAG: threonine/serine dehydratase [Candidatus Heimdallarchaeota archaeon]
MSSIFKDLTLLEVKETLGQIRPYVIQTPIIRSYYLEKLIGKEIYLKLEYLQPTRSFKVRGACSKALSLDKKDLSNGLVTASGGNHGLGVCYAGNELEVPVIVFLPVNTAKEKVTKIKLWGGKAILHGEAWDEANLKAQEYAHEKGLTYVHPFDDLAVVKGQGTIALELLEQNPYLDAIIASVGGGGLISGLGVVARQMKPEIKIWGVETVGCDAVTQSFRKGYPVRLPAITSIADTLGAKQTTESTLARIKAVVNDMQTVTDEEALEALQLMLENEKILVEPATSCSIAALVQDKFDLSGIKKICIILCGSNVSLRQLREWKVL